MEPPVAVVVTNKGATWKKVLNCYGVGKEEALRQLQLALSKVKESNANNNNPYYVEHISLPSLDRMATRISLGDGFLYFFSCESNVFVLEELVPHFAGIRCSSKSTGLTVEDVIKDSEKVVPLIEGILMPYLVHYSPKLVDPHYLSSSHGRREHKKTFDLSQAFPRQTKLLPAGDAAELRNVSSNEGFNIAPPGTSELQLQYNNNKEASVQRPEHSLSGLQITNDEIGAPAPAPAPKTEEEQASSSVTLTPTPTTTVLTGAAASAATILSSEEKEESSLGLPQAKLEVEVNMQEANMPKNTILESASQVVLDKPVEVTATSSPDLDPMQERESTDVFLDPAGPSENVLMGETSAHIMKMTPAPPPVSPLATTGNTFTGENLQKINAPKNVVNFSASPLGFDAAAAKVDSPLSMIQNMFQAGGGDIRATTSIKEDISIKVKGGCVTHARCSGSVRMKCQGKNAEEGEEKVCLQLHPLWLRQLNSLHVTPGSEFVQNLRLDCGSCTKFRAEGEVLKYSVRPREYLYPMRTFFQVQVSPRSVALEVHVLSSPKLNSIHTGRCSVDVQLNDHVVQQLQLKDSTPKAVLDSVGSQLVWENADVLGSSRKGVVFKAVFTKAGGGLVDTEDLMNMSQTQARISSNFNYLPFVRQNCQVLKQLDMTIDALPSTFVST